MYNFIDRCINGDALMSEIDDYIDQWHESDSDLPLYDYLGMSKKEYALYLEDHAHLASIITAHKTKENIITIMKQTLAVAARSNDASKAKSIQRWLEHEKLWD